MLAAVCIGFSSSVSSYACAKATNPGKDPIAGWDSGTRVVLRRLADVVPSSDTASTTASAFRLANETVLEANAKREVIPLTFAVFNRRMQDGPYNLFVSVPAISAFTWSLRRRSPCTRLGYAIGEEIRPPVPTAALFLIHRAVVASCSPATGMADACSSARC